MKRLMLLILTLLSLHSMAQNSSKPRLVVGLVIDQMRWDYLYRYNDRYGNEGFKRMLREGFSCENTFIHYTPSYTGAGHAGIYTGSVPALHGIMGNYWYSRKLKRNYYCCEDSTVNTVGSSSNAGKMSPVNMWGSTVSDELRLATNFRSKAISIALKDRGSILPGGHSANAAYWFDNASGGWISSSFYMKELPAWVNKFNDKNLPDFYLAKGWNTLYPIETYKQSTADSNRYESKLGGEDFTFPHITANITTNKYETFRYLPSAITYSFEMAKAAIAEEKMGKRDVTDFLALSISTTDYSGHYFGPTSIEIEDMYLRLDQDLAGFLKYLDATVGKGQYMIFLTSDHGAAHNPYFMRDHNFPVATFEEGKMKRELNDLLEKEFKVQGIVETWINSQVYLDHQLIAQNNIERKKLSDVIISWFLQQPSISNAVDLHEVSSANLQEKLKARLANGYNQRLSGDIQYVLKPQWFENWRTGTTHGLWNPYDTHIPLLFMGWNIQKGKTYRETYMHDIAPTVSALLNIQMPNASIGEVIAEVIK